jgi:hypothetical protein
MMSGTPVYARTRVPIQNLLDYIEGGEDLSEFLDDFPFVTKEVPLAVPEMVKIPHLRQRAFWLTKAATELPNDFVKKHEVCTGTGKQI